MGNSQSTEGSNNLIASYQRRRSRSSSSASLQKNIPPTASSSTSSTSSQKQQSFQLSEPESEQQHSSVEPVPIASKSNTLWSPTVPAIQEHNPISPVDPANNESNDNKRSHNVVIIEPTIGGQENRQDEQDEEEEEEVVQSIHTTTAPVSTGKSGWVSSTGGASPWGGSLSSSTSSHHRASISGPYYRTRGMSVTRDSENDEDLSKFTTTATTTAATTQVHSTSVNASPTSSTSASQQQQQKAPPASPKSSGVPTIITWTQGGNNVYITGTFNGWKHKLKLVKSTHDFTVVLELPPGTHRLKFIVDDEWKCSNDMETATDPDGNLVNYLQVMNEDDESECDFDDNDRSTVSSSSGSVSTEKYSNVIPPELLQLASLMSDQQNNEGENTEAAQKKALSNWEKKQPEPPGLPPHLEKVLLNSQTISEEDNSILHEPNHVTLNHLYACSIKDNVMALATTSRYRKKYVTTMYYRPVFPKN